MRAAIHNVTQAASRGDLAALRRLVGEDRALANVTGDGGWTPLHLAAQGGHLELARFLLESGANVHLRSSNPLENQPLHAAAAGGHASLVRLLLENGARVNARERSGWTALHGAAQAGDEALTELLLEHGADVSAKTDDGLTPLDLALSRDHHGVAARLRESGGEN